MEKIKYRLIKSNDNIVVILEDGGVADIRYAEELDQGDGRQSVTEYYQERFTVEGINSDEGIWGEVGEGKMYCADWETPFDDPAHIQDALNWLSLDGTFELDESIWPELESGVPGIGEPVIESTLSSPQTDEYERLQDLNSSQNP